MNLKHIHNVYLIGIGGIGMSALARYFYAVGKKVAGYDKTQTPLTQQLEKSGILIHYEDNKELIPESFFSLENTLVIYTPAIPKRHTELNFFVNHKYTVLKRSEVLGLITKNSFCFAIAGTHGKTTTSTILGHILEPLKATAFLGGISENYKSNLILGENKITVVEADEFDRSFLNLSPNIACITSMDADHLDIYGDADALEESFQDFSKLVSDQLVIANGLPIKGITYGIEDQSDYTATNVRINDGTYVFDVNTPNESIEDIEFSLPGAHNIMNAMAALTMANRYGVSLLDIKKRLLTFKGIERRFSYRIKREDLVLIDDYAHHPTEIEAVAKSIQEMYPKDKSVVVFQPHLFSRTRDFADDFSKALSLFDEVLLLDIYPARELPIEGVNSEWLLSKVTVTSKKLSTKESLVSDIKDSGAKIVAMLGAGDVGLMVDEVCKKLLKLSGNEV